MSLDEALKRILEEKRSGILIVDDRCDVDSEHDDIFYDHITNEENLERFLRDRGIGHWGFVSDIAHARVGTNNMIYESKSPPENNKK